MRRDDRGGGGELNVDDEAVETASTDGIRTLAFNDESEAVDGIELITPVPSAPSPTTAASQKLQTITYAVGHFYNDLCASMWFNYFMLYLEKVQMMRSSSAGLLMLIGQITDAICTPLVGFFSDRIRLPQSILNFGRRKAWHAVGTLLVALSFPFIFSGCFICGDWSTEIWEIGWFAHFIVIFQCGWAAVQISHLALMPELSHDSHQRSSMTAWRTGFGVMASMTIFGVLWLLLHVFAADEPLGPVDANIFRGIGIGVSALGLIAVATFYFFVKEPTSSAMGSRSGSQETLSSTVTQRMEWNDWFCHWDFYKVAFIYMCTRMYINVSQVYFPFYVTLTREMPKIFVAILPMIAQFSMLFVSLILGSTRIQKRIDTKLMFVLGAFLGIFTSYGWFFTADQTTVFVWTICMGVVNAVLLNSAFGVTNLLINKNTETGAFVFGALSFLDKLANGVCIQIIELINPTCEPGASHLECALFYRNVMAMVPGACVVAIFFVLMPLNVEGLGERQRLRIGARNEGMDVWDDQAFAAQQRQQQRDEPAAAGTSSRLEDTLTIPAYMTG